MDIGTGIMAGGGILWLASIPGTFKSLKHWTKAHQLVAFNANLEFKPILASNWQGNHVGVSIGF